MIVVLMASLAIATAPGRMSGSPGVLRSVLHALALDTSRAPEAEPIVSRDGRFSVTLPPGYPPPKTSVSNVRGENGPVRLRLYSSVNQSEGLCIVSYCDFTGASIDDELGPKVLDGAKEGALANMSAHLEEERTITLDTHPGRSIRFTAERDSQMMHGRIDFYLVGVRLYQVCFIGATADALSGAQVRAYFESFKLLAAPVKQPKRRR